MTGSEFRRPGWARGARTIGAPLVLLVAATVLGSAAEKKGEPAGAASQPATPEPFRVITYNIHAFDPVAPQEQGKERIARIRTAGQLLPRYAMELSLHRPDVIALQEASPKAHVEALARELKMHVAFFPGGWKNKGWPDGIAGAVLSRHRIIEAQDRPLLPAYEGKPGEAFSRHFGRVLLDVGGRRIAVCTVHLLPSYPKTEPVRQAEIEAVSQAAQADRKRGHSVLVLGDMNHRPFAPEYRGWIDAGFADCFAARGRGMPLTCAAQELTERIDYVFALGPIAGGLKECRVLHEGAFRCHAGDPTTWALSDHLPVLAEFDLSKR